MSIQECFFLIIDILEEFFVSYGVNSGKFKKKRPFAFFYKKKFIFVICKIRLLEFCKLFIYYII